MKSGQITHTIRRRPRLLNVTNRDKILGRSDYAEISGILKVSLEEVMVLFTDMILEKLATIA